MSSLRWFLCFGAVGVLGLAVVSPIRAATISTTEGFVMYSRGESKQEQGYILGLRSLVPGAILLGVSASSTSGTGIEARGDGSFGARGTMYLDGQLAGSASAFCFADSGGECYDVGEGRFTFTPYGEFEMAGRIPVVMEFAIEANGDADYLFADTYGSLTVTYTYEEGDPGSVVPEPTTFCIVGLGLGAAAVGVRRRRLI